ncbi:hypothetical protein MANES_18G140000v8 [Manihot esculenta]|uniref:Uncharacterized protein n=1 Tax=Manihot esculenta TaxID=3983 RepID=A0ACB7G277_MANES|nr:hypothetical protein MANES_18G140000v8 [Manihot esculenta]
MGCRESKHAVATGNTISRKKSDAGISRKNKDIKTADKTSEKESNTDSLVQQEESQNVTKCLGDENAMAVADEVNKDITDEYKELKEVAEQMNEEDGGVAVEDQEEPAAGRLISKESPNRLFSSRKVEDVEAFTAAGRSDMPEFFSPRLGSDKESLFSDCVKSDDVVVETLVQQKMVCILGTTPTFN